MLVSGPLPRSADLRLRPRDRLRRIELGLLGLGALACLLLLGLQAHEDLHALTAAAAGLLPTLLLAGRLLLVAAALLAPWLILALLGAALRREPIRPFYRWAGMALSGIALLGAIGLLTAGRRASHWRVPLDAVISEALPALLLLTACALLYGGLVFLARRVPAGLRPASSRPASPRPRA